MNLGGVIDVDEVGEEVDEDEEEMGKERVARREEVVAMTDEEAFS